MSGWFGILFVCSFVSELQKKTFGLIHDSHSKPFLNSGEEVSPLGLRGGKDYENKRSYKILHGEKERRYNLQLSVAKHTSSPLNLGLSLPSIKG